MPAAGRSSFPCSFSATWTGGNLTSDIQIRPLGDPARVDSRVVSHFGHGVLTFHTGYLFRTSPGWALWCRGAPNTVKHGIVPLDGLVETDWLPFPFTMNWRFTRPGTVRFDGRRAVLLHHAGSPRSLRGDRTAW